MARPFARCPTRRTVPGCWRAWVAALWLLAFSVQAQSVRVITHPGVSASLDQPMLRALFTMRMREWPDGTPVRVFVLPDTDELNVRFCRELLGTYPYVLRGAWDRAVFTGTGFAPTTVRDEREMRERVRTTPGAVGYVGADAARPEDRR